MVRTRIIQNQNPMSFIADKTVKLWKITEKTKRAEGFNLRDDNGTIRSANNVTNLRIPVIRLEILLLNQSKSLSLDRWN